MRKYWILACLSLTLFACREEETTVPTIDWSQEKSSNFSKNVAIDEDLDIKMYLEQRKSWKMNETGSGLRYYIYQKGTGEQAASGMLAEVKFDISLLDGTKCYKTENGETETFKIDRSEIETGVQEGIKYMHVGDKAKLIIPSHLGHGLSGDFVKIPPLTTLVIDLELVSLTKQ